MPSLECQAEIDRVTKAQWSALLNHFEDANIYQTWSYGAVRWGERNMSHLLLKQNGEVIGMAQLRIVAVPMLRCGIAYLRWGPLWLARGRAADLSIVDSLARALREEYVRRRGLLLRVLPNAFVGSPRAQALQAAFSEFKTTPIGRVSVGRTFLLDLSPPLETLRKRLDQKWRNQLNRAEREGLTVEAGEGPEDYGVFSHIYKEMWEQKRFSTTVDVQEFAQICRDLPEGLRVKILTCRQKGVPASSIVCSPMGNIGIYLLGATNEIGRKTKAAYLLQWTMIKWLKENGFQYYDLGGIDSERNPGVFHFKSGLSGQDVGYVTPLEACENPLSFGIMRMLDWARSVASRFFPVTPTRGAAPAGGVGEGPSGG
jgi:lipid II:glycine glycyltransferase (peptidoglycan interpeptide bridge formation enzyme)